MGGVKRSVYVFLCSLLGVLLFLVLQRIIVLSYLILVDYGAFHWTSSGYLEFVAIDDITLLLSMLCGSWYGIWLGNYWYELVYERGAWRGSLHHARNYLFPPKPAYQDFKARVEEVKHQLVEDLSEAENLVREIPREILKPVPIRRRIIRKKPATQKSKKV